METTYKKMIMQDVRENGLALEYVTDELQDDEEVVLIAIKNNCWALKYASERLQKKLK